MTQVEREGLHSSGKMDSKRQSTDPKPSCSPKNPNQKSKTDPDGGSSNKDFHKKFDSLLINIDNSGTSESSNGETFSPFGHDVSISLKSYLNDINYMNYQQQYLNEGINRDISDTGSFDSPELKDVRQEFIHLLNTEHGYTLTSQFASSFIARSLLYRGVENETNQKVVVKMSPDIEDCLSVHLILNEWYYLSGTNVVDRYNPPYAHINGWKFKNPKTLPKGIPGIMYPKKAFSVFTHQHRETKSKCVLVYTDNDYLPIRDYYKSNILHLQQSDAFETPHSMTSSNSNSSMHHNSFSNNFISRDDPTLAGVGASRVYNSNGGAVASGLSGSSSSGPNSYNMGVTLGHGRNFNEEINSNKVKTAFEVVAILNDILKVLKTLRQIHNAGIVHNGLTCSTILKSKTSPDDVRVANFEYSFAIQPEDCSNASRRPFLEKIPEFLPFMAPEAIGDVHKGSDFRTDFYSIGVILYELLVGRLPFFSDNPSKLIRMHTLHKPVAPNVIASWIGENLSNVIMRLLEKDPWNRYPDCVTLINDLACIKNDYISEINEVRANPFSADSDSEVLLIKESILEKQPEDRPAFIIPQKMFGRYKEYEFCASVFNSVVDGLNGTFICGPSGGGKTTMLHDLEDMAISKQEFYFYWKFNESDRKSTIYGAFFYGLTCCFKQILASSKENIEKWRHIIISNIPVDLNVLMRLSPEFRALIGPKYSTILRDNHKSPKKKNEYGTQESLNEQTFNLELRIRYLIKTLYGLFATNGMSLFLDDIQFCTANEWRMAAEVIDYLNSNDLREKICVKYFVTFDDVSDEQFSKSEIVAFLRSFNVKITEITLNPIKLPDFIEFWKHCVLSGDIDEDSNKSIASRTYDYNNFTAPTSYGAMSVSESSLHEHNTENGDPNGDNNGSLFMNERLIETAKKLWHLTNGNILKTKSIIRRVFWQGKCTYYSDRGSVKGSWHLDLDDIDTSTNLRELLLEFIKFCLPPECITVMRFACMLSAPDFNLMDLAIVSDIPLQKTFELVSICIEARALIPTSSFYKLPFHLFESDAFPFELDETFRSDLASRATFSFSHDSIRSVVLEGLRIENKLEYYNRLCALNFYKKLSPDSTSISTFLMMARHFNNSVSIAKPDEHDIYFNVLIKAGRIALGTYNVSDSLKYFESAQTLVKKHDTVVLSKLLLTTTQLHYFMEDFDKCLELIDNAIETFGFNENTFLVTKIRCLSNLKRYDETLQVAIQGLNKLGIEISSDYEKSVEICQKFQNQTPLSLSEIRSLKDLPSVKDESKCLAYEIMSDIIQPTYYSDKGYIKDALAHQMIVMMYEHGTSPFCAVPLIYLANALASQADRSKFLRATEYARVAMFLADSDESLTFSYIQSIYELYLSTIASYMEPMSDLLKYYEIFIASTRTFFRSGVSFRDMITGSCRLHLLYLTGHPLDEIYSSIVKQDHEYYAVINKTYRNLQVNGVKLLHGEMKLEDFENNFDRSIKSADYLFVYNFFRIWYLNCLERYEEIMNIVINEMLEMDSVIPNTLLHIDYYFALILSLSCSNPSSVSSEMKQLLTRKVTVLFNLWDEVCPSNFHAKNLIIKATLNENNSMSELDTLDLFEEAIESAKLNGNWYDAAWGNLLCANWLIKTNKKSKRITYFAKNSLALFKSLDMTLNYDHLKKKYADYLKEYNWAGIDAISSLSASGGHKNNNTTNRASAGNWPGPPIPKGLGIYGGKEVGLDFSEAGDSTTGTGIGSSALGTPVSPTPNPLNRKLAQFFSSGIQSSNSRKDKLLGESFSPQKEDSSHEYHSNESVDLNEAVKACLDISDASSDEDILMRLLESAIMFSDVDYGVVIMKDKDEPFIKTIGSPNSIYTLSNEPLSSRTDLCPFSLILYVFQTGQIVNKDEDDVLFQNRFSKDDYYQKNKCYSMICIPLKNSKGIAGALYLESQRLRPDYSPGALFLNKKKKDLIDLLCSQATVSLAKIDLYSQMEHAKRIAEDATAEKASFLANMSHEIRTPFNSLLSCSLFLLDTDLNKTQREYVETIRSSAMVTLNIIDGILAFSKIEHGSFTLANDPFSLIESVENAIQLVGEQAALNDLELVFRNRCPNIKNIFGDETRFRQIVINLVGNAVKFTSKGHILVEVSAKEIIGNRYEISVSVEDTGIGIPKDSSHKVFGAFSQVDSSSRRIYGGSGLGLAISKKLADLMGGTLTFDSVEGKGSTFYFVVNAEAELFTEPEIKFDELIAKKLGTTNKTLIIDSHKYTRESLRENLIWFGLQVLIIDDVSNFDSEKFTNLNSIFVHYDQFDQFETIRTHLNPKTRVILISQFGKSLPKEIDDSKTFSVLLVPFQKPKIIELIRNLKNSHGNIRAQKYKRVDNTYFATKYPLRILIAEDNLVNLRVALQHLKKLGYIADHAKDGVEVIDKCLELLNKDEHYDVIFMDIQMPRKDGITTATELKDLFEGDGKQKYLPEIVALTANVAGEDRQRSLACGMIDFVSKPILPHNLMTVLQKIGERKVDTTTTKS